MRQIANKIFVLIASFFVCSSSFAVSPLKLCQEKAISSQPLILDTNSYKDYRHSLEEIVSMLRTQLSGEWDDPEQICHRLTIIVKHHDLKERELTLYIDQYDAYLRAIAENGHYYGEEQFLLNISKANKTIVNPSYNHRSETWLASRSPYRLTIDNNAELFFDAIVLVEASKMLSIEASYTNKHFWNLAFTANAIHILQTAKTNYAKQVRCYRSQIYKNRNLELQYAHLQSLIAHGVDKPAGIDEGVYAAYLLTDWYSGIDADDSRARMRYINPSFIQQAARKSPIPTNDQCRRQSDFN